jgi:Carboxypeptidase regulatory-like domain/TonB dependent receptor/TonB-dependent Receptor Plug Domain
MRKWWSWPRSSVGARSAVVCVLLFGGFAGQASAQALYGSLVGNVTDSSGAAIPGATVTATQQQTNLTREVVSSEVGAYAIPNIPSGTYQVVVTLPGFQTFTARSIIVTNLAVRVDAKLSVGALQESVSVSATAAILQTESAAVQSLTTAEQLSTLPTSGRSFASFLTLMPGVAQPDFVQSGGINNPARSMAVSINGAPSNDTVVRLDGVSAVNQYFQGNQSYTPGLESIESVNLVTNAFDADQGMAGAASVNVQIKSGTNTFKGSAYEYGVDSRLRSRAHFLPTNLTKGSSSVHQLGGTLGGPVVHNKFFFFFADEVLRQRTRGGDAQGQTGTNGFSTLPTAAMRQGDFSATGTVIYDPRTGTATGTGRVPFAFANCPGMTSITDPGFAACNFIPKDRINPISASMLSKLILPTLPGLTNNYYALSGYDSTTHKIDTKLTYAPGPKLNLNGRYSWLPGWEESTGILPSIDSNPNPLSQGRRWSDSIISSSVSGTSIISPTFVVDGVFGFTKHDVFVAPNGDYKCWGAEFKIPNVCQPPRSLDTSMPAITVGNYLLGGVSQIRDYVDPQWEMNGNAGWTHGAHSFKFGVDYQNLHQNHYETQPQNFTFGNGTTALNGGTAANNFNAFAGFLLGEVTSRQAQAMSPLLGEDVPAFENGTYPDFRVATLRSMQFGSYARDQWQISRKVTAAIGVRWEYYSLPTRKDHGLEVYDFATNKFLICGVNGNEKTCGIGVEKNLFTPRLGLAYRPTESSVIRLGYSRNPQNDNPGRAQLPPNQAFPATIVVTQNSPGNNFASVGNFSEGSPIVPLVDLSSGSISLPAGTGVTTFRDAFVRGKISSWNVTYQKALSHAFSAQIGYVANRQEGIVRNVNLNYGQIGGGPASQPFQPLGITSAMNVQTANGKVHYDSLQLSLNKRMAAGFSFTTAYTYSKTTDWWAGAIAIPAYFDLNKSVVGTPHKLNISTIYELPFGAGKKFLNKESLAAKLAGGWQVNSFLSAQSGSQVTVTGSGTSLNAPGTTQRPDKVKDTIAISRDQTCPTCEYFDVTAFKNVTDVRIGNGGFRQFRGPTAPNLDMSLFRTFQIARSKTLQFRVEVFNVTNTPHYANPSANIANVTLNADGTVQALNGVGGITDIVRTGRQYDEREWRLGLRMGF